MAITHTKGNHLTPIAMLPSIETFISGLTGWIVDKSVTGELYVHTTTDDATVCYFSMGETEITTTTRRLSMYFNTGFNTGLAVDAQPGVAIGGSGGTEIFSFYIDYSSIHPILYSFTGDQNYVYINIQSPDTYANFTGSNTLYFGRSTKDFTWAGGTVGFCRNVSVSTCTLILRCEETGYEGWYGNDAGIFFPTNVLGEDEIVLNNIPDLGISYTNLVHVTQGPDLYLDIGNGGLEQMGTLENFLMSNYRNTEISNSGRGVTTDTTTAHISNQNVVFYIDGVQYFRFLDKANDSYHFIRI